MEENRYEIISDIIHDYKDMEPKDLKKQHERLVDAVKAEAVRELNNTINSIKRI